LEGGIGLSGSEGEKKRTKKMEKEASKGKRRRNESPEIALKAIDYRSSSLLSVSCYRLVTNFQETNRQQETHARREDL